MLKPLTRVTQVAAKAVVRNSLGQVLILREAPGHDTNTNVGRYQLPGGRLEAGEHFLDALNREVMEETGLSINVLKPLLVGEWEPIVKGIPHHIIGVFMLADKSAGELRLSEEHDELQWVDAANYKTYQVIQPDLDALTAYFATSIVDNST